MFYKHSFHEAVIHVIGDAMTMLHLPLSCITGDAITGVNGDHLC